MKKIITVLFSVLTFCSCGSTYVDDFSNLHVDPVQEEEVQTGSKYILNLEKYSKEEIIQTGIDIIECCGTVDNLYLPNRFHKIIAEGYNNKDIDTIINIVKFYDEQPVFGDTVGESGMYDTWRDMILNYWDVESDLLY